MKTAAFFKPLAWFPSCALIWLLLAAGLMICPGCGKKATLPVPTAAPIAPATNASGMPVATQPIFTPAPADAPAIAATPAGSADLRQLNHYYIGWLIQTHRRVRTFEEFVAATGVQVPPPPAGKKYVIDGNGYINVAAR